MKPSAAKQPKQPGIALVTGASSGIGQAIAEQLGNRGFRVYAAARSLPDYFADPAVARPQGAGELRPIRLDMTDESAVQAVFRQIIAAEGRLDCLVQAAGFGLAGAVEDTTSTEARSQMETNFFGAIHILPLVLRQMRSQRHGLIVQIGSVAGFVPIAYQAYYSASKAALAALTLAMADELRPFGVRCMVVQPGDTATGFTRSRIMAAGALESDYTERCQRSIAKMAKSEADGISAMLIARRIVRQICRRRPPLVYSPELLYKLAPILISLMPVKFYRRVIGLMYDY